MDKVQKYKINNHLSNIDLFLYNDFEMLCFIPFDKDLIKTKIQAFEKILYCCEKWHIKISKRKANEIAKEIKWYLSLSK